MHLISSEPYLDQKNECYKNIITVSPKPTGSLLSISKLIKPPKLSPFIEKNRCCNTPTCIYAIMSISNTSELMCIDEIPELFSYLVSNGYTINTELTKMMNDSDIRFSRKKIICFVS